MTTRSINFMKKYKLKRIFNRDLGNGIQQLYDNEKYLTDNMRLGKQKLYKPQYIRHRLYNRRN